MSSSNPSSKGNVQYPALTGISENAAEIPNNSSVVSSQTQGSADNNTGGGSASNDATDNANQPSTRQTRSSTRGASSQFQSLPSEDRLNGEELRLARQREIERIIGGRVDDAFGEYHVGTQSEMTEVYRTLSALTHPDKQTEEEWKRKASQAQQSKS